MPKETRIPLQPCTPSHSIFRVKRAVWRNGTIVHTWHWASLVDLDSVLAFWAATKWRHWLKRNPLTRVGIPRQVFRVGIGAVNVCVTSDPVLYTVVQLWLLAMAALPLVCRLSLHP